MRQALRKVTGDLIGDQIRDQRGVALILAVSVIALLIAVSLQFSKEMFQELSGSANRLSSSTLGAMAKSGYTIGAAILEKDGQDNQYDSTHDAWAKLESDNLSDIYGDGMLLLNIRDLGGRFPVNQLVNGKTDKVNENLVKILKNLLAAPGFGGLATEEIELIVSALIDWVDKNDNEFASDETEDSYYMGLESSYKCKNGPLEFIEELLLIRGITTDLYYGNQKQPGLRELLTVADGQGKININTAPAAIIQALSSSIDDTILKSILEYRGDEKNKDDLQAASWITTILPGDVNIETGILTTSSEHFRISATARHNDMEKTLRAMVKREKNKITMISRKVE